MRLSLPLTIIMPVVAGCGGRSGLDASDAGDGWPSNDVSVDATRDVSIDGISDASADMSTDALGDVAPDSPAGEASDGAVARAYLVDPAHTSSVAAAHVKPPLALAWTAKLGEAVSYPLVVGGIVYVTTNGAAGSPVGDAQLIALDASTGSPVWQLDLGPVAAATIAYDDGRLFAMDERSLASARPQLRAYDAATGALDWTATPDNQNFFDPPPVAYRGIVYVYGNGVGGTVYAYDETSGAMLWSEGTEGGEGSPAVSDDGVFIAEACQKVYAFDRVSGASRWMHSGSCTGGGGATPLIYGQWLYVHDPMGDLVLDVANGSPAAATFVSTVAPALDGAHLFNVAGGAMGATGAVNGGIVWAFTGDGRLATSPLVADGYVYVGSSTGNLFALREADGAPVWVENTGVPLVSRELFTTEPRVALAAGDGLLLVPVGSSLFGYASAGPDDGGLTDATSDAGCSWSMTPVRPSPTTPAPNGLAIGDLNHDGRLDVVIPHEDNGLGGLDSAGVLLGHGDGSFGAETLYPTDPGAGSYAAALGDFNGDGNLDVVVANPYSAPFTVSVFLGKGDGTLQPRVDYPTGMYPFAVAVADFNGDAVLDVAVLAEGLNVLLGKGDGTFQPGATYPISVGVIAMALADVNADGKVDAVVVDQDNNDVVVQLGNGDGTFQGAVTYPLGTSLSWVAVDDLNGDGKKDLAVTGHNGTVSVLLGAGDGTFQLKGAFLTDFRPTSVGIADLNRDGYADLAVTNGGTDTVSILLGNGDGTFQPPFAYGTGTGPRSIGIADLNGDGWLDLAMDDQFGSAVSVFLGGCR
jgi:outer membrane protein assembly factor BamB